LVQSWSGGDLICDHNDGAIRWFYGRDRCCRNLPKATTPPGLLRSLLAGNNPDLEQMVADSPSTSGKAFDDIPPLDETSPRFLAELLAIQEDRETSWADADLAALLRHQMSIPLCRSFPLQLLGQSFYQITPN
jgi:hypothetical protein